MPDPSLSEAGTAASEAGAAASEAGAATGAATAPSTILIDVDFELITPDGKRKVDFRLTKTLEGGDIVWTINFSLFERADTSKNFDTNPNVRLSVTVDKTANDAAEKASAGLTPTQAAQATGPASIAAKAADANPALKPQARKEVQRVVTHA